MISKTKRTVLDPQNWIKIYNYNLDQGFFMRYDEKTKSFIPGTIAQCRENFSGHFKDPTANHLLFFKPSTTAGKVTLDIEGIDAFFVKIKKILGIKDRTIFSRVEMPSSPEKEDQMVDVEVPPFWMENGMRRAIFTLFLRCACCYYKGDLEAAFRAYNLLMQCRPAIDLFLSGHIHPAVNFTSDFVYRTSILKSDELKRWMLKEPVAISPMPAYVQPAPRVVQMVPPVQVGVGAPIFSMPAPAAR